MSRLILARSLCALAFAMLSLPSALAEDASRERIFLVFAGEDVGALEAEALKFQAPVLGSERFAFAGTQEMEAIYSTCAEEIGTDAAERRECQLRAANRIMVTQVLQLSGSKLDAKTWDVALEVWSPESNELLWGDTLEVEAKSLRRAAREAYPELAGHYLCWRGVESACPSSAPVATAEAKSVTTAVGEAATGAQATGEAAAVDGMVFVQAGPFLMGSSREEADAAFAHCTSQYGSDACPAAERFAGETPQREVEVEAFYIDMYEVTLDAYAACVDAGSCVDPGAQCTDAYLCNWGRGERGDHPVNNVTWYQARAYCEWAGKRLPSEEEWEKAARGTDGRLYPWGDEHPAQTGRRVGNFADATMAKKYSGSSVAGYNDGYDGTAPVGSFPGDVSVNGAYDMAGNVAEWTSTEVEDGAKRVYRGGEFFAKEYAARTTYRYVFAAPGYSEHVIGFRCARSVP